MRQYFNITLRETSLPKYGIAFYMTQSLNNAGPFGNILELSQTARRLYSFNIAIIKFIILIMIIYKKIKCILTKCLWLK